MSIKRAILYMSSNHEMNQIVRRGHAAYENKTKLRAHERPLERSNTQAEVGLEDSKQLPMYENNTAQPLSCRKRHLSQNEYPAIGYIHVDSRQAASRSNEQMTQSTRSDMVLVLLVVTESMSSDGQRRKAIAVVGLMEWA
jgi:hypothetical protein